MKILIEVDSKKADKFLRFIRSFKGISVSRYAEKPGDGEIPSLPEPAKEVEKPVKKGKGKK